MPDFVQAENPNFISFMKAYYEFMESAELKLISLGSIDSIIMENQPIGVTTLNYIILEDTNLYRPDQANTVLTEDTTTGAFVNDETIVGQTSKATAVIRVEDINANSRLFISSQNDFIIGEQVVGSTSNATGVISDYTANPVQNIQQLMEYADIDDTIDSFFDQFKEAFLRTIPKDLTSGVNERNLLKNIKDLYRAKGQRKGHELFFRILLNEDVSLSYPKDDMLRVSAGNWSEEQILRVTKIDDTILMEDSSAGGDIFILNEDGGQIMTEDSVTGISNLLYLVGQEITQNAVQDLSILPGGAYYGLGYPIIGKATALVDSISSYKYQGQDVYELVLSNGSLVGTFATGHTITATSNDDPDATLYGKLASIVTGYNLASTSSQYYDITDPITVTADNGNDASVKIGALSAGNIPNIIVDVGGSGYTNGDVVSVNNANTNGAGLVAEVAMVNGGISPEAGDLVGEWGIELETNTPGAPGDIELETASGTGLIKQQEAYDMLAIDHIVLENYTVFGDGVEGNKIAQEVGTGNGDVTDVVVNDPGEGYTKTPLLVISGTLTLSSATGLYVIGSTITGSISNATGTVISSTLTKTVYKPLTGTFVAETITGGSPVITSVVSSVAVGSGATIYAKGVNVGKIEDVTILDAGVHYTSPVTLNPFTNFLCTDFSVTDFLLDETVTGGTSGATGTFKNTESTRNILQLANVVGTFVAGAEKSGETITGNTSGATAVIDSYTTPTMSGSHGVLGETSGRYLNEDGFIDERSKKIQDSYYYQDFSYVVKSSSSINTWRDQLLAAVHPAGWQVFGQVDIATAVQSIANITSIVGLGPLFKVIYTMLIGRRLGTTDQKPLNPFPAVGIHDPADFGNSFRITGSSKTIAKGELITGDQSGATATAILDTTNDHGVNLLSYELLAGGDMPGQPGTVNFIVGESCTCTPNGGVFTIVSIHGLQGFRDITLFHYTKILKPPIYMVGDKFGFAPTYSDAHEWKFSNGMVASAASSRTFGTMAVYPVYLNMLTTITSAINNSVATIPVAETANLPTQGTIKLGTEEITYTGRSSASGAGNLTGATRGANGTTAASHLINANLTLVRLARSQTGASGYRIMDWAEDWKGTSLTIGDIATYPQRRNDITPPTEITIWKT